MKAWQTRRRNQFHVIFAMRSIPPSPRIAIGTGEMGTRSLKFRSRPFDINPQPAPISLVCELVAKYSDPMPEIEYAAISIFGREFKEALTDRSYGTGARLLLKLIAICKDRYPPKPVPD
jgi:hypothetical protein